MRGSEYISEREAAHRTAVAALVASDATVTGSPFSALVERVVLATLQIDTAKKFRAGATEIVTGQVSDPPSEDAQFAAQVLSRAEPFERSNCIMTLCEELDLDAKCVYERPVLLVLVESFYPANALVRVLDSPRGGVRVLEYRLVDFLCSSPPLDLSVFSHLSRFLRDEEAAGEDDRLRRAAHRAAFVCETPVVLEWLLRDNLYREDFVKSDFILGCGNESVFAGCWPRDTIPTMRTMKEISLLVTFGRWSLLMF